VEGCKERNLKNIRAEERGDRVTNRNNTSRGKVRMYSKQSDKGKNKGCEL
jgi:hypothetical protein